MLRVVMAGIGVMLVFGVLAQAQDAPPLPWKVALPAVGPDKPKPDEATSERARIEATIINPFRSANLSAQVAGTIRSIDFQEGDFIREGQVVVRIADERYRDLAQKVREKLAGLELELKRAEGESKIQAELLQHKATTRQEVNKISSEVEILRARIWETEKELELAVRDLDGCTVKAPFSGCMAVRYKQPDENVDRLENIFSIVDSSKVYAVANVEEHLLPRFHKGMKAVYVHRSGRSYEGEIDRVGGLIDPKSKTKKVYCLIDNGHSELEVGMTGSLGLER